MQVRTAQLAGGKDNADRVLVLDDAVIVLDGATAFEPTNVDARSYAATLGKFAADRLDADPRKSLPGVVADAITHTIKAFRLGHGPSPSSTIAILRARDALVDLYVLGDSPIYYGIGEAARTLIDDRLETLAIPEHKRYRSALMEGAGFTDQHRRTLVELQRVQRMRCNRPDGYWIASTDPTAAGYGISVTIPREQVEWAVLATDGAADLIQHHAQPPWFEIAQYDAENLTALLVRLHEWESVGDPDGRILPRAKRHDDKTLASVLFL